MKKVLVVVGKGEPLALAETKRIEAVQEMERRYVSDTHTSSHWLHERMRGNPAVRRFIEGQEHFLAISGEVSCFLLAIPENL